MFFSRDVLDCQDFEENILVLLSKFEIWRKILFLFSHVMRFLGVGCGSRDHWPETHLFGGDDGDGDDGDGGGYDTGT